MGEERHGEGQGVVHLLAVDHGLQVVEPGGDARQGERQDDIHPIEQIEHLAPQRLPLAPRADVFVQIGACETRLHPLARRGAVAARVPLIERPVELGELALDDDAAHAHQALRIVEGQRLDTRSRLAEGVDGPLEGPHHLRVRLEAAREPGAKAHSQALRAFFQPGREIGNRRVAAVGVLRVVARHALEEQGSVLC